ncbi:MAG: 1-(5-phosphoribosyl)-5-[(5-phosphoribosylamino)methylideneamino]imidazole-4-carboxamide isomerase [Ignavibacteria bacterium]|jgi:phosphoribosylformimino-5-aminoimidazole carboxamide ribotide isomerase|nr:1-(5-phosphoribosyl)-5-[(5-phosphoribosylamino)methylideneamino]imidazole-4-carboxamide isomerase [Ignavibacteria bacterium]
MIVIPAIDLYQNKIVRLKEGDFSKVTFYENSPLEQARIFEESGFSWLHMVDLEGSKTGSVSVLETVREIKAKTGLKLEFGGGVRDEASVAKIFSSGADRVIIGSLSVENKKEFEAIVEKYGAEKVVVAADVKDGMIAVRGWTEKTAMSLKDHITYCMGRDVDTFLCTDISRDGMLSGTNIKLYQDIISEFPGIKLIASGGIKDIEDVRKVAELNAYAVVVGKAIYENRISLKELSEVG